MIVSTPLWSVDADDLDNGVYSDISSYSDSSGEVESSGESDVTSDASAGKVIMRLA